MNNSEMINKEIVERVTKLSEAIFSVKGYSIDIEEIKDYIEIAISELDESQLEILKMTYVDRLSDIGIAKKLGCTIQQVEESFEHLIFIIIEKSAELYNETEMKRLNSLNELLDECITELKEK